MNMETLTLTKSNLDVELLPSAIEDRTRVIAQAQAIKAIADSAGERACADALRWLKSLLKTTETSRKAVKEPVLDLSRKIDGIAKEFASPIAEQFTRLDGMMTAYIKEQRRIAQEAAERAAVEERRQREEQARIEAARIKAEEDAQRAKEEAARKSAAAFFEESAKAGREAARAQSEADAKQKAAKTARDAAIEAEASRIRASVAASKPAPKPEGVGVSEPWTFEVLDIGKLYLAAPELVQLTVKTAAINAKLREGMRECPGLRIFQQTKLNIR